LSSSTADSHTILHPENPILHAAKIKLTIDANELVHDIKADVT
jgi:hypothetical protein